MKFWFTRKTPKDVYDGKVPYDATVEQVLRVAQEVSTTPAETDREVFDFVKALRPSALQDAIPQPTPVTAPWALSQPMVSRATRDEMEHRLANYRAFQKKLNDEREARIRRTMDDVRAQLRRSAQDSSPG
jgi:hypothetical protein